MKIKNQRLKSTGARYKTSCVSTIIAVFLSGPLLVSYAQTEDIRTPIVMTQSEKDLVLGEMRAFLDTIRQITVSLGQDKVAGSAEAARKMGMAASGEVTPALREKLPQTFKKLAMQTHQAFDLIALDAESLEDTQHTLEQVGVLLGNCVSCHAIYRLEAE